MNTARGPAESPQMASPPSPNLLGNRKATRLDQILSEGDPVLLRTPERNVRQIEINRTQKAKEFQAPTNSTEIRDRFGR